MNRHQVEMKKLIERVGYRHSVWQAWQDFLLMSACAISNAVDVRFREKREAAYMATVKRYNRDEANMIANALGELVEALECGYSDILGETYMALELGNKWAGQFFTPYPVCKMMAMMTGHDYHEPIAAKGFITANDPACGGGATLIAMAEAMMSAGLNPQQHLHITAQDVDEKCVHMCYLQLSLLHIPAVVIHGNSLSLEERAHWYTPAHIIGLWDVKLRRGHLLGMGDTKEIEVEIPVNETGTETFAPAPAPMLQPVQQSLFDFELTP